VWERKELLIVQSLLAKARSIDVAAMRLQLSSRWDTHSRIERTGHTKKANYGRGAVFTQKTQTTAEAQCYKHLRVSV
jgi:hypothetical protein